MISDELRSGTESPQPFGTQGSDSVLEQWEDARDGPPFEFGHHEKLVDAADKLAEAYRNEKKLHEIAKSFHDVAIADRNLADHKLAKAEAENKRLRDERDTAVEAMHKTAEEAAKVVNSNERLRAALVQIARRGQVFDAKGTHSKWVVQTARKALAEIEKEVGR